MTIRATGPFDVKMTVASRSPWRKFFESRGTWYRKKASWWVMSAKKEETRRTCLARLVAASGRGVEL